MNAAFAQPSTAPLLELRDVDAGYGPFRAIFGVSLRLQPGHVLALLGSNGAGKTTVARVCSGLIEPTRGTIVFPRHARGANWAGDGTVTMVAAPGALECSIDASEPGQLEGLKGALARHLDRFAFREAPLAFDWHDG